MREYYSELNPQKSYSRSSIPADLAFRTPTYVHSHASALAVRDLQSANDSAANFMNMIRIRLKKVREADLRHARAVSEALKTISEKVEAIGINPDNLLADNLKKVTQKIDTFRKSLDKENRKMRVSIKPLLQQALLDFENNNEKTFSELLGISIFQEEILELFSSFLNNNFIKGRGKNRPKSLTIEDLKKMTFKVLQEQLDLNVDVLNDKVSRIRTKYVVLQNNDALKDYWENFLADLKVIAPLVEQEINSQNAEKLTDYGDRIKNLINTSDIYKALGWLMELSATVGAQEDQKITASMKEAVDALSTGASTVHKEGNNIIIQDSVSSGGHAKTTDIRFIIKKTNAAIDNIISIGASLKSSGEQFHKTNLLIDSNNSEFFREYSDFLDGSISEGESYRTSSLLYYFLLNYEALQTFAIGDDSKETYSYINQYIADQRKIQPGFNAISLLDTREFISNIPGSTASKLDIYIFNIVNEVFMSIIMTVFIKALLGSFFNTDAAEEAKSLKIKGLQDKPIPLFLIAGNKRFWTYEILDKAINILSQSGDDPQKILGTFYYYGYGKKIKLKNSLDDFSYLLKKLFYAKFLIIHDPEGNNDPYDVSNHPELSDILAHISDQFKAGLIDQVQGKRKTAIDTNNILKEFFCRDWSIRFDYSNLT